MNSDPRSHTGVCGKHMMGRKLTRAGTHALLTSSVFLFLPDCGTREDIQWRDLRSAADSGECVRPLLALRTLLGREGVGRVAWGPAWRGVVVLCTRGKFPDPVLRQTLRHLNKITDDLLISSRLSRNKLKVRRRAIVTLDTYASKVSKRNSCRTQAPK